MTLQIRHPVVESQFCTFDADSAETLPIPAGRIVRITGVTTDGRTKVDLVSDSSDQTAFGWLMQKVKAAPSDFPAGYVYRGDLGTSVCYKGDPVAVAFGAGAVYETDQYVDNGSNGIAAGTLLYVDDDGKLEDTNADSGPLAAIAMNTLTATEAAAGKMLRVKALL